MRKLIFYLCDNKGADQLHGDQAADQCLCFRYINRTIPRLPKSKISRLYNRLLWLYSLLCVRPSCKPEGRFSHDRVQIGLYVTTNFISHLCFSDCITDLIRKKGIEIIKEHYIPYGVYFQAILEIYTMWKLKMTDLTCLYVK